MNIQKLEDASGIDSLMLEICATEQISNLFLYSGRVDYHQEQLQLQFKSRVSFCSWLFGYQNCEMVLAVVFAQCFFLIW